MPPVPTPIPTPPAGSPGLRALFESSAFAALDSTGWVRVTGEDRVRWLNGMVTNSIQALTPGEGCYSFVLNAQGRIQGDLMAWMQAEDILLETTHPQRLLAWLDRYIIMDDVELTLLSAPAAEPQSADQPAAEAEAIPAPGRRGLLLAGPHAESVLQDLLGGDAVPAALHWLSSQWNSSPVQVFHPASPLVPRFELWLSDTATCEQIAAALAARSSLAATPADVEHLRLLEGTPLFGGDIRDKDLPQETAQTHALHFSKGCYLGQEIVERIRSRGAVHRTFSGFELSGAIPPAGTQIFAHDAPDRAVGEFTSAGTIDLPSGRVALALGYIRRDVLERKSTLTYTGGNAIPAQLPFRVLNPRAPDAPETASEGKATASPLLQQT